MSKRLQSLFGGGGKGSGSADGGSGSGGVGGAFSLTMVAGETLIPIHGEYRVLDRPHALAFTWQSARTTEHSLVELGFEAVGEQTKMTLRHVGFPDASARDDHDGGWAHILDCLLVILAE